ncbi:MAG: diguanylate cyclase [Elusimicrobia bacterium]|nr:diguanylate cyclase [Elusimicrobiota bacterium]
MKKRSLLSWDDHAVAYHRSLQGAVLEDVRKMAFCLAALYVGLFTFDALTFPPAHRGGMLAFDGALIVFYGFVGAAAGAGRIIRSRANAWGALLGTLAGLNILTAATLLKSDLLFTAYLGLTLIGIAAVLLSAFWMTIATLVLGGAWLGVVLWFPSGDGWLDDAFVFATVIGIAYVLLFNRILSFTRLQRIRSFAALLLRQRSANDVALALGRTAGPLTGAAAWSVQWVAEGAPLAWVDGKGALSRNDALRRAHTERAPGFDAALAAGRPFFWGFPPAEIPDGGWRRFTAGAPGALALPLLSKGSVLGVLWLAKRGHRGFGVTERDMAETCVAQARAAFEAVALLGEVQQMATTDELTGLFNRRQFFFLAERENARRRGPGPGGVAVVMADIDHFKKVNDTHGHGVGDIVLKEVARRLKNGLRLTDVVGRYGGEEFAVLLPDTSPKRPARWSSACATPWPRPHRGRGPLLTVTASFGIASRSVAGENLEHLLTFADRALYRAKDLGRNRVEVHAHESPD